MKKIEILKSADLQVPERASKILGFLWKIFAPILKKKIEEKAVELFDIDDPKCPKLSVLDLAIKQGYQVEVKKDRYVIWLPDSELKAMQKGMRAKAKSLLEVEGQNVALELENE
jgi:hypothetical protein